jgi:hypothetical protein
MKYSIIILVETESDEFRPFFGLICDLLSARSAAFEVIVVANATGDFVQRSLSDREGFLPPLMVITFHKKVSSSVGLNAALKESRGELILTLSPYQELRSQDYAALLDAMSPEIDLVLPFRKIRRDPMLNILHSRLLNFALKLMVGGKIHDMGCNAKLVRRHVLEDIELYGNMFRYLPALASQKGYKIKEIECEQKKKTRKAKFYAFRLYLDRLVEIANLFFSTNFSKKPLRFFSLVGSGFILAGLAALVFIVFEKLFFSLPIGNRPLLMVAVISIVVGAQFASFGLLGEIISFVHGRSRQEYNIETILE